MEVRKNELQVTLISKQMQRLSLSLWAPSIVPKLSTCVWPDACISGVPQPQSFTGNRDPGHSSTSWTFLLMG